MSEYDRRVAGALRHPRLLARLLVASGSHPSGPEHEEIGLATKAELAAHAATPHAGGGGAPEGGLATEEALAEAVATLEAADADITSAMGQIGEAVEVHEHDAAYVAVGDARLSDARTPLAHGHDEYAAMAVVDSMANELDAVALELDGKVAATDPRLTDAREPLAHDHDAAYVATDDPRLSDDRDPTPHDHDGVATEAFASSAASSAVASHTSSPHGLEEHALGGAYHTGAEVLPTTGQKNALAGTSGTPGDTNRFVTNADARLSDARTPAAHSHSDADLPAGITRDAELAAAIAAHVAAEPHEEPPAAVQAFPVGSVFLSVVATDPATLLGYGTWAAIAAGKMLVGRDSGDAAFDTAEETGGAKTHTHAGHSAHVVTQPTAAAEAAHTHGYSQVPNHTHPEQLQGGTSGATNGTHLMGSTATGGSLRTAGQATANPTGGVASGTTQAGSSHTHALSGAAVDGHSAHDAPSHLPPYFVVYAWKRVS